MLFAGSLVISEHDCSMHVLSCAQRMSCIWAAGALLLQLHQQDNLYIVMEYLNGGDCSACCASLGALEEDVARTYIAETVLALEYCHTQVRLAMALCCTESPT